MAHNHSPIMIPLLVLLLQILPLIKKDNPLIIYHNFKTLLMAYNSNLKRQKKTVEAILKNYQPNKRKFQLDFFTYEYPIYQVSIFEMISTKAFKKRH